MVHLCLYVAQKNKITTVFVFEDGGLYILAGLFFTDADMNSEAIFFRFGE